MNKQTHRRPPTTVIDVGGQVESAIEEIERAERLQESKIYSSEEHE
jgi:hypothetical protein